MSKTTDTLEKIKEFVLNLGKEEPKKAEEVTAEEIKEAPVEDLTEVKAEEAPSEEVKTPEYVTVEDFAKSMDEIKSLFSKQYEKFEEEKKKLEADKVELKSQLDEKPDEAKVVHAPKDVKVDLSTKDNRFLNVLQKNK